jgi:hypothetical protein
MALPTKVQNYLVVLTPTGQLTENATSRALDSSAFEGSTCRIRQQSEIIHRALFLAMVAWAVLSAALESGTDSLLT